mmetsp:Transcript_51257/g.147170  ORF Transcript_51257/g.147170 Transcript_51257/m.147170 type:complete len:423 (-) Transcript_51257:29-1297(-)
MHLGLQVGLILLPLLLDPREHVHAKEHHHETDQLDHGHLLAKDDHASEHCEDGLCLGDQLRANGSQVLGHKELRQVEHRSIYAADAERLHQGHELVALQSAKVPTRLQALRRQGEAEHHEEARHAGPEQECAWVKLVLGGARHELLLQGHLARPEDVGRETEDHTHHREVNLPRRGDNASARDQDCRNDEQQVEGHAEQQHHRDGNQAVGGADDLSEGNRTKDQRCVAGADGNGDGQRHRHQHHAEFFPSGHWDRGALRAPAVDEDHEHGDGARQEVGGRHEFGELERMSDENRLQRELHCRQRRDVAQDSEHNGWTSRCVQEDDQRCHDRRCSWVCVEWRLDNVGLLLLDLLADDDGHWAGMNRHDCVGIMFTKVFRLCRARHTHRHELVTDNTESHIPRRRQQHQEREEQPVAHKPDGRP